MTKRTPAFMSWDVPPAALGVDEYETPIMAWQQGRCAMCGNSDRALVEDHCHDTGKVRGMLCRSCNLDEGRSAATAWDMWRAGMNPARLIGDDRDYVPSMPGRAVTRQTVSDHQRAAAADAMSHLFSTWRKP